MIGDAGVLGVLKPPGPTSQQVVAELRRWLGGGVRVGHGGTLDPAAAGVLPVGFGAATRLLRFLHLAPKVYRFELVLGLETDSWDQTGRVVAERPAAHLGASDLEGILAAFTGPVRQQVPQYSARHVDGRRLYEYARRGELAAAPETEVTIHALELAAWAPGAHPRALCTVRCSAGTYVRSLAEAMGRRLGVGGHLGALVRLEAGGLSAQACCTLEEFRGAVTHGAWGEWVLPPAIALGFLPAVQLDPAEADRVASGIPPGRRPAGVGEGPGPVRLLRPGGALAAVAQREVAGNAASFRLECVLSGERQ